MLISQNRIASILEAKYRHQINLSGIGELTPEHDAVSLEVDKEGRYICVYRHQCRTKDDSIISVYRNDQGIFNLIFSGNILNYYMPDAENKVIINNQCYILNIETTFKHDALNELLINAQCLDNGTLCNATYLLNLLDPKTLDCINKEYV